MDIQAWHPLSVHFPIAFLILSGFLSLYLLFNYKLTLAKFNVVLLLLGIVSCIISLYTGDIDDAKVSRQLCDPTVLKQHENFAYYVLWSYLISLIAWIVRLYFKNIKINLLLTIVLFVSNIVGISCLVYVGHLGASLVYEQAAGVNVPSEDCHEF